MDLLLIVVTYDVLNLLPKVFASSDTPIDKHYLLGLVPFAPTYHGNCDIRNAVRILHIIIRAI